MINVLTGLNETALIAPRERGFRASISADEGLDKSYIDMASVEAAKVVVER